LQGIAPEELIFLDESGINLALIRRCARSLQGTRADGERPNRSGKNVSVNGAISLSGLLVQWSALGAIDGLTFEAFIAQKLVPQLWKGAVVIMDNCSIHKNNPELEALIAAAD
jgi:DDE superfamily endonuclease